MADDIAALADTLEIVTPFVCGWSDRGQVALELAIRHGTRFGAFIFGGVQYELRPEFVETLKACGVLPGGEIDIDRVQAALPEWLAIVKATHKQSNDHWLDLLRELSQLWHRKLEYPEEVLSSANGPVLVVIGDRDQFIPVEHAVNLYRALPNAELAILPNGDHMVCDHEPEQFCRLVGTFLHRQQEDEILDHEVQTP